MSYIIVVMATKISNFHQPVKFWQTPVCPFNNFYFMVKIILECQKVQLLSPMLLSPHEIFHVQGHYIVWLKHFPVNHWEDETCSFQRPIVHRCRLPNTFHNLPVKSFYHRAFPDQVEDGFRSMPTKIAQGHQGGNEFRNGFISLKNFPIYLKLEPL